MHFEEANLNKFIDFLKKMPHFSHWTKNALSRLTYYMPPKKYYRNQEIFKEGEPSDYVFVVLEGEFETVKKVKPEVDKEARWNFYIGPIREKAEILGRVDTHFVKSNGYFP